MLKLATKLAIGLYDFLFEFVSFEYWLNRLLFSNILNCIFLLKKLVWWIGLYMLRLIVI